MANELVPQVWRPKLVAYEPLGAVLGDLAGYISATATFAADAPTILDVYCSLDGPQADWLQDGCDLEIFWPLYSDPDDAKPSWQQFHNGYCQALGKSRDRLDKTEVFKFSYIGLDYQFTRALVRVPDDIDPELGDQRRVRTFPSSPGGPVPTYGRVISQLWDDEAAAVGWGGTGVGALSFNYGGVNDSHGVPWVGDLGKVELGLNEKIADADKRFRDADLVDALWIGTAHRAYSRATFGRDLTLGNEPVRILDGDGMTAAPQDVDFGPVASHCRVLGDKGLFWDFVNPAYDATMHGTAETIVVEQSDIITEEAAQMAADKAFADAKVVESNSFEQRFDLASVRPGEHYRLLDTVYRQVQRHRDKDTRVPDVPGTVVSFTMSWGKDGVPGRVTFDTRKRNLGERLVRQVGHISGGARVGAGGLKRDPGDDPREPEQVQNLVITPTNEADRYDRGSSTYDLSWDAVTDSVPDADGRFGPILIDEYIVSQRSAGVGGTFRRVASVEGTVTAFRLKGFDPEDPDTFRVRAVSHTKVKGAWSANSSPSVPADQNPADGADLIRDSAHVNASIRAKRAADAGAGFAFELVSGEYVAAFTTTTPELRYSVTGTPTGGRRAARPDDVIVVDLQAMLAAGSTGAVRAIVYWYDYGGSVISTSTVFTSTVTGSYAFYSGTVTAPALTAKFGVRVKASTLTGTTPKLRVRKVNADRRTTEDRMHDDAVSTRTIINGNVVESKHADDSVSTRTIIDGHVVTSKVADSAIITVKLDDEAVTNAKVGDDAITTLKIAANVDIDGTLTTSGGSLTVGGFSASQINFAGGADVADAGGGGLSFFGGGSYNFHDDITYVGTITDVSERASKTNVKPIPLARARALLDLVPVTFKRRASWSREYGRVNYPERKVMDRKTKKERVIKARSVPGKVDNRQHVGLIAEDVEAAGLSEIVGVGDKGAKGVDYTKVTMFLLPLVKDLYTRIEALESQKDQASGSAPEGT